MVRKVFFSEWRGAVHLVAYMWVFGAWVTAPFTSLGQDFDNYQRIAASGALPEDFLLSSRQKYLNEMESVSSLDKRKIQKAKAQFFEESSYYMNQLLLSGKVVFNDVVTNYLNEVAGYLLRDRPELKKELRFYVVKSPSANAFATNDGLVMVNMGLLAKLENEAQLAFVLCHEISHYIKKHPLDIFLKNKRESRNRGVFGRSILEEALLARNNYTREKEQEADLLGLDLFLATDYDLESAVSAFDILKYAHLPYRDLEFNPRFLESEHLSFPASYLLDSVQTFGSQYEEFDDSRSTHPSPEIRKSIIAERIKDMSNLDRKPFIFGAERFNGIQQICRFETAYLLLFNQRYEEAIYHCYLLLQDHPDSRFLKKIIAHSLYGLSQYTDEGKFWDVHIDYEEVEGESQKLNHLLEKLEDDELNLAALTYVWNLLKTHPDEELEQMTDHLMVAMGVNYRDDLSIFLSGAPSDSGFTETESSFARDALAGAMQDTSFSNRLQRNFEVAKAKKEKEKQRRRTNRANSVREEQKELSLGGFNLGLDRVVFVDPFYKRVDQRKENRVKYLDSEESKGKLITLLKKHSESLNLEYSVLSPQQLEEGDIQAFNDLILLNEWVTEKSNYDEMGLVSINHEEIQYLKEKYKTSHFVWTGAISLTSKRKNRLFTLLAGIILPPAFPFALFSAFSPHHDTFLYTMVYDIETGEYLILYPKHIGMKDKPDVLNSALYDMVFQIKTR